MGLFRYVVSLALTLERRRVSCVGISKIIIRMNFRVLKDKSSNRTGEDGEVSNFDFFEPESVVFIDSFELLNLLKVVS
ncbi:hypothetical protein L596_025547 [Steinernema carpocapsae]|uniref:Uncharacterized protein n=1 Tax=Steinernema carpocapsae TaxID=34508 RepID=A0A4U5M8X1_STECR|nr:hypothetical protein L596_025547 [Steinernema carpocapsae]